MEISSWSFKTLILSFCCVSQILSSQVHPSLTEYLIAALGSNGAQSSQIPSGLPSSYQRPYGPSYQNYQTPPVYQSPPKPSTSSPSPLPKSLSAVANLAASIPVSDPSLKTPIVPKGSDLPSTPLDSNVLNNLAIALQLLIVSNILNSPLQNFSASKFDTLNLDSIKFETVPISPLNMPSTLKSSLASQAVPYLESPAVKNLYSLESLNLPSSKFLGSSNFAEAPIYSPAVTPMRSNPRSSVTLPSSKFLGSSNFAEAPIYSPAVTPMRSNPRSSVTLMSPYEALSPNSPFSDPILSSAYSSSYSKRNFQSPYASILSADGNRDLFSMSDFL